MMKKIVSNLLILVIAMSLFNSCEENYPVTYDDANIIVGIGESSLSIDENGSGSFTIYLGGPAGTESTEVTLTLSVEGIDNPAIEGTDFTLSSKSVNLAVGETTITVSGIDNDLFTGNKQFRILLGGNSKNYKLAAQNSIVVTIVDDEHPLQVWTGNYTIEAESYAAPGDPYYDARWEVVISTIPDEDNKISITGIAGSAKPVIATLDPDEMTIEIDSPSELGIIDLEGDALVSIYYGTDALIANADSYDISQAMLIAASKHKITGTIEEDGTIRIDRFCLIIVDELYNWDCYNTTWKR